MAAICFHKIVLCVCIYIIVDVCLRQVLNISLGDVSSNPDVFVGSFSPPVTQICPNVPPSLKDKKAVLRPLTSVELKEITGHEYYICFLSKNTFQDKKIKLNNRGILQLSPEHCSSEWFIGEDKKKWLWENHLNTHDVKCFHLADWRKLMYVWFKLSMRVETIQTSNAINFHPLVEPHYCVIFTLRSFSNCGCTNNNLLTAQIIAYHNAALLLPNYWLELTTQYFKRIVIFQETQTNGTWQYFKVMNHKSLCQQSLTCQHISSNLITFGSLWWLLLSSEILWLQQLSWPENGC